MDTLPDTHITGLAESCVARMGDIFWDYDEQRDAPLDYIEPHVVATKAVVATLHEFAETLEGSAIYTVSLRLEYRELIQRLGADADDGRIESSLVMDAAWTPVGACTVLRLAKDYGTSILRNALALAEAMAIEDGEAGF